MIDDSVGAELACRCRETILRASGRPITVANCHCQSCKQAAEQFERAGSQVVFEPDGGVAYALFRKDRVVLLNGREHLTEHRLAPDSATRRVVASCCHTPMFLDFTPGHWLSLYRTNLAGDLPQPEVRAHTPRFFLKLLGGWVAMGFRQPKVAF